MSQEHVGALSRQSEPNLSTGWAFDRSGPSQKESQYDEVLSQKLHLSFREWA